MPDRRHGADAYRWSPAVPADLAGFVVSRAEDLAAARGRPVCRIPHRHAPVPSARERALRPTAWIACSVGGGP